VYPVSCEECEFDRDGNQVRLGTLEAGQFRGVVLRRIRDELGRVQEELWEDETGKVKSRHVYQNGPAGKIQDDFYVEEKLFGSTTYRYDSRGNVVESDVYKADGTLDSHVETTFDENGNDLESVTAGPGDVYWHVILTYSSDKGYLESFTSLNRNGTPRLHFTLDNHTVLSYWQQPGDQHTYGSGVCFAEDEGTERDCREYNWDGTFSTTHYVFSDKTKRNPTRVVLSGPDEERVMEADYEYEFDSVGNWIKRTVWVWAKASGRRAKCETHTRKLTYYADDRDLNSY